LLDLRAVRGRGPRQWRLLRSQCHVPRPAAWHGSAARAARSPRPVSARSAGPGGAGRDSVSVLRGTHPMVGEIRSAISPYVLVASSFLPGRLSRERADRIITPTV